MTSFTVTTLGTVVHFTLYNYTRPFYVAILLLHSPAAYSHDKFIYKYDHIVLKIWFPIYRDVDIIKKKKNIIIDTDIFIKK